MEVMYKKKKRYSNIIVWVMFGPYNYNLACELRGISTQQES